MPEILSEKPQTYAERAQNTKHPLAKRLFELMDFKRSNLCVAADVTTKKELLQLAQEVGPHICILKTHVDIIEDFDQDLITQLQALAQKHDFLIFEDRKFADIGNTGMLQYNGGIYKIASWAYIVNAHTISGPDIITSLAKAKGRKAQSGLLLLAEMSSQGNLITPEYTQQTVKHGEEHKDFVMGFISRSKVTNDPDMLCMTPGVQFKNKSDGAGQQYLEPQDAINNGSDIIIVGRGIYADNCPAQAAAAYKLAGWQAYKAKTCIKMAENPIDVQNNQFVKGLAFSAGLMILSSAAIVACVQPEKSESILGSLSKFKPW